MTFFKKIYSKFESQYNKSFNRIPFSKFILLSITGIVTVFLISFSLSIYIYQKNNSSFSVAVAQALLPSTITTTIALILALMYPNYKKSSEKSRIEDGLLYTVSYMTVLANCGLSVDQIFGRSAEIEQNPAIRKLMTSYITDIKIKGYDIEQGLRRLIEKSPSKSLSDVLNSISNASWTSGDLKEILSYHFEVLDRIRKDETENMINSLTVLSEIYVAMMVIAPIMLIIMFTLLSVLISGMNQLSTISILNSITFIFLPFVGAGFLVLLDSMRGAD
jgi:archaellum biogenesis protein FlaJ (TadC family)